MTESTHRDIPGEVVKRAQLYDREHFRQDRAGQRGGSWGSVPPDQVRRLLWGACGGMPDRADRPWPLPPAPTKLACFFCDGETYNPDGICGGCKAEGRNYDEQSGRA